VAVKATPLLISAADTSRNRVLGMTDEASGPRLCALQELCDALIEAFELSGREISILCFLGAGFILFTLDITWSPVMMTDIVEEEQCKIELGIDKRQTEILGEDTRITVA
jgi:hypothetical protein